MKNWGHRYYALRGYLLVILLIPLAAARMQSPRPVEEAWLMLVLGGVWLRFWAGAHIGSHSNGTTLASGPRARTGPYRFLRHPLYLSNLIVAAGLIGFANCLELYSGLALWILCLAHHLFLIGMENSLLNSEAVTALPSGWKTAWVRQNRNIGYTFVCVGLLFLLSFLRDYL